MIDTSGMSATTGRKISTCRALLGDMATAYCLGVNPGWLDAMEEGEPDGGISARLEVLVEAIDLAGPDQWLLRAWLIGAEPGDDAPATMLRAGELGAVRVDARMTLEDPQRVVSPTLAAAKGAIEQIERSGLVNLRWFGPHLEMLRALVAEHEQLLRSGG